MKIEGFCGAVLELDEKKNKEMPEKVTVLIFPGGGYSWLSARESHPVERTLHEAGYRAAVLYYDTDLEVLGLTPLKQAAWGLGKVREFYPGDPVYVLGFSAGSHCAGSLSVHWNHRDWEGKELFSDVKAFLGDPAMPAECFRPDRAALSYPVVTSGPFAHFGSFTRLTGIPEEEIRRIVTLLLKDLKKRAKDQMGITLKVRQTVRDHIAEKGFDEKYGARPLRRAIQNEIEDELAESILSGNIKAGQTVICTIRTGKIVFQSEE